MKSKLWDAAELIEMYGWIQRAYGNESVGFCLLGAGKKLSLDLYVTPLSEIIKDETGTFTCISTINDNSLASETEAILLLGFAACLDEDALA